VKKVIQMLLRSSMKTKAVIIIAVITVAGFSFLGYQTKGSAKVQHTGDLKPAVDVMSLQRKDMTRQIELTGQTVPESQVDITAKYSGKIMQVNVGLGDHVVPGQTLIVQDTSDVDAALAQNAAASRQADADAVESNATFDASYQKSQSDYQHSVINYQRYKRLYDIGATSKEALENAEQVMTAAESSMNSYSKQIVGGNAAAVESKQAARDKAHAAVDSLQNQRSDLTLRAPRDGVIGYRQAEVGMMAQTGQKLLSIVDNSNIYVDCSVSEQDIGQIVNGMPVDISIDAIGKTYTGKIIYISPSMDSKTQTFTIRIALDNRDDNIKTGMFARTTITIPLRRQTLFVPKEAVLSLNGTDHIFVVDSNNQVTDRVVKLGLRNDKSLEIISGINAGEQVAITNLSRLKTGITVTPTTTDQ